MKGSLVLGLFIPINFLMVFLNESRVKINMKAAEQFEKSSSISFPWVKSEKGLIGTIGSFAITTPYKKVDNMNLMITS